jgi:hypothetical protein
VGDPANEVGSGNEAAPFHHAARRRRRGAQRREMGARRRASSPHQVSNALGGVMIKPDTPFPKHWLYYIALKYAVIAAAVVIGLYVASQLL